jgi:hypothetical protein
MIELPISYQYSSLIPLIHFSEVLPPFALDMNKVQKVYYDYSTQIFVTLLIMRIID